MVAAVRMGRMRSPIINARSSRLQAGRKLAVIGDTLFPGGGRKTVTTPETFISLFNDVKSRFFDELPDDTWFYPGHGDDSTLGKERPNLDEWRARGWQSGRMTNGAPGRRAYAGHRPGTGRWDRLLDDHTGFA